MANAYTVYWSKYGEHAGNTSDTYYYFSASWHVLHDTNKSDSIITGGNFQLIEPILTMQIRDAGEFSFTVPATHYYRDELESAGICFVVAVRRDGEFIWGGHPITASRDIYGNLSYTCEGALGFLSDVYLRPFYKSGSLEYFFGRYFFQEYKDTMEAMSADEASTGLTASHTRFRFVDIAEHLTVPKGAITSGQSDNDDGEGSSSDTESNVDYDVVENGERILTTGKKAPTILRYTGKNLTVLNAIHTRLTDYFGGVLKVKLTTEFGENSDPGGAEDQGIWSLMWDDYNERDDVTLEVGKNITAISKSTDYTDFCTALVPVDANGNRIWNQFYDSDDYTLQEEYRDTTYEYLYSPDGMGGSNVDGVAKDGLSPMYVNTALAKEYGIICGEYAFSDDEAEQLLPGRMDLKIRNKVKALSAPSSTVEVSFADTSAVDGTTPIDVGDIITYIDRAAGESAQMVVTEREIHLDDPTQSTLTLGGKLKKLTAEV